ncbi:MAG TPA: hypothetical protein VM532_15240, partial [Burkholderiales bacterium]|nr:hypothetical protein [Burkholderiales bacterium]
MELIPHLNRNDDPRQALRIRRYYLAAGTSVMVIGLLYACYLAGLLERGAFLQGAAIILFWVFSFYAVFRTGLNLRAPDPSLTLPQMSASTLTMLYMMYAANVAHAVFPVVLVMIFLFGVLRFATRTLLFFSAFVIFGDLAVIILLWYAKQDRPRVQLELLQWLTLTITLPWFALMGGYIRALRERVHKSNADLQSALQTAQTSEKNLAEAQRIA